MASDDASRPSYDPDRDYGVLLGWLSDPAGDRISLKLQSSQKVPGRASDIHEFRYFLSREQAVQLGHNLFQLAGATPPRRKRRGFIERLIGD
ncbi:MAG: hypothetical protein ACR2FJ_07705 [Qipengyuania sp.]